MTTILRIILYYTYYFDCLTRIEQLVTSTYALQDNIPRIYERYHAIASRRKRQEVKEMTTIDKSDTYKIGMSKYFTAPATPAVDSGGGAAPAAPTVDGGGGTAAPASARSTRRGRRERRGSRSRTPRLHYPT
jgi:hypothetical protein